MVRFQAICGTSLWSVTTIPMGFAPKGVWVMGYCGCMGYGHGMHFSANRLGGPKNLWGRREYGLSLWRSRLYYNTVVFVQFGSHTSRTPSRTSNSHARHADFEQVLKSFGDYVPDIGIFRRMRRYIAKNFHMSQQAPKTSTCEPQL